MRRGPLISPTKRSYGGKPQIVIGMKRLEQVDYWGITFITRIIFDISNESVPTCFCVYLSTYLSIMEILKEGFFFSLLQERKEIVSFERTLIVRPVLKIETRRS